MQLFSSNRYLRLAVLLVLFAASVSTGLSVLIPHLFDLNNYRTQLTDNLSKQLNRKVSLGNCRFSWVLRPSFEFSDFVVREKELNADLLSAKQATFTISLLPLLTKKVELHDIELYGVRLNISRNKQGLLNIDDLLKSESGSYELHIKGIKIQNGSVHWSDAASPAPVDVTISDINLQLGNLKRGSKTSCKFSAALDQGLNGTVKGNGHFRLPPTGDLLRQTLLDIKLDIKQLEHQPFWHYFGKLIPFPATGGAISLNTSLKGRWQDLRGAVDLTVHNPTINWPRVFHGKVAPQRINLKTTLLWNTKLLQLSDLRLALDGFSLKGSFKLSDLNTSDPQLDARAQSDPFEYVRVKSYIPFGIIDADASEFIERRIRAGTFRLVEGTLNGRISKIARFGEGDNASVLHINGTADQAVIQYGEQAPTFRNIKTLLELKGRHFTLTNASGLFGNAPFTMSGAITEYATTGVPSSYPFTMQIHPTPQEVAWLANLSGVDELSFKGTGSTLRLQGDGPTSAYRMSGEWQLASAAYEYPRLARKPAGMPSSLSFSAVVDKDQTKFTSVSYQLAPLRISGSGLFRYADSTPYLAFNLESNKFQLDSKLPILNDWQKYQLNGSVQSQIQGAGNPRALDKMLFNGTIKLAGFSLKPHAELKPVTDITTSISFKGRSLETNQLNIRYGSTPLAIKGRVSDFTTGEAELLLNTSALNPVDFGISAKEKPPLIKQFSTRLSFGDGKVTIRNMSGKLPKSTVSLSGTIKTGAIPDLQLRIAATHLDIEELIPLFASDSANDAEPARFTIHADLTAETGSFIDTPLAHLTAAIRTEDNLIKVKGLSCDMLGGKLYLNGQLARPAHQPLKWSTSFQLEKAKAEEILQMLTIKREVRGQTSVQASLTASGDTIQSLRKTVNGSMQFKVERGVLKRLKTLSKVISILNVSQLLTFSLPDMARDGMPFTQITATVGVKDGVFSTQDFFIDSKVMDISSVGSVDIAHETINMLIGVRPLQTVDKVVSRIPVFGWILSGGSGSLITTYFEAKGSWDNPEVTAIPVKSMARGTLDIFRRAFELPVRLFTDTGEVLLGNRKERPKSGTDPQQ